MSETLGQIVRDIRDQISGTVSSGGNSIPPWDYRQFSYSGGNLTTVTYKSGGAAGEVVAVQTLAYDGSDKLISETWS